MIDIVERLRNYDYDFDGKIPSLKEAADEIVQLRKALDVTKSDCAECFAENIKLHNEIERLKGVLNFYGDKYHWQKKHDRETGKDFYQFSHLDDGGRVARNALNEVG